MEVEDMQLKIIAVIVLVLIIAISIAYFLFMMDRTPPEAPVLASPINGLVVDVTPGLNGPGLLWYEPELGLTYEFQIAKTAQFTQVVLSRKGLPPASYTVKPSEAIGEGTHYWRVRAIDRAGNVGSWSEVGMFLVKVATS